MMWWVSTGMPVLGPHLSDHSHIAKAAGAELGLLWLRVQVLLCTPWGEICSGKSVHCVGLQSL